MRPTVALFLFVFAWSATLPACAAAIDLNDDLGFNTMLGGSHPGELISSVLDHTEEDARFIINDVVLSYAKPRTTANLIIFEQRLRVALAVARRKSDSDAQSLELLLEGGASFFLKQNRRGECITLMEELVALERAISPNSDALADVEIACARAHQANHSYARAEELLLHALALKRERHGYAHQSIAQVDRYLYFLYMDMDNREQALASRREMWEVARTDIIAQRAATIKPGEYNHWPEIINTLDSVTTAQDIVAVEKDASKQAWDRMQEEIKKENEAKEAKDKEQKERQGKEQKDKSGDSTPAEDKKAEPMSPEEIAIKEALKEAAAIRRAKAEAARFNRK